MLTLCFSCEYCRSFKILRYSLSLSLNDDNFIEKKNQQQIQQISPEQGQNWKQEIQQGLETGLEKTKKAQC